MVARAGEAESDTGDPVLKTDAYVANNWRYVGADADQVPRMTVWKVQHMEGAIYGSFVCADADHGATS